MGLGRVRPEASLELIQPRTGASDRRLTEPPS